MLRIKLKVFHVCEEPNGSHILLNANVVLCDSNAEPTEIPFAKSDEEKFAENLSGHIQMHMQKIGVFPLKPKPIQAAVSFLLTPQMFNSMGRPTVGDYIQVDSMRVR